MGFGETMMDVGEGMEVPFDILTKGAAVAIILPAFTFKGPSKSMSRSIYLNMCNPGTIIKVGGAWIAYGDKMREASRVLGEQADKVTAEVWEGEDANAFHDAAGRSAAQLDGIANQATQIGILLLLVGTYMSAYWGVISYYAYGLFGMALYYQVARWIPHLKPTAEVVRLTAIGFGGMGYVVMEGIENAAKMPVYGAASLMGFFTGVSWMRQAANGNMDDLESIGNFAGNSISKLLMGTAALLEQNLAAPGGAGALNKGNWFGLKLGSPNPFTPGSPGLGTIWGGVSQFIPRSGTEDDGTIGVTGLGVTGAGVTDHAGAALDRWGPDWATNPDEPDWSNDGSFGS